MFENKTQRLEDFCMTWSEYADAEYDWLVSENVELMKYLQEEGFFTAPASTKYHGAYEGGLYDHSSAVFMRLAKLTVDNNLEWQRPISPFIIGMFHDLCKCDQYIPLVRDEYELTVGEKLVPVEKIVGYQYNDKTILKGHGAKSVMILSRFITLTEEEMLCIRYHMGAYEKEEWAEFDQAIRKYPNVLFVHLADQLASKIDEK